MSIGEFIKTRRKELGLSADDLAIKIGKNRATVYRYESNYIEKLPADVLVPLAAALRVTPGDLISKGEDSASASLSLQGIKNIVPIERRMVPVIGTIAAGTPILADEHIEAWVPCDARCRVDFGLKVQGDSMIDAGIEDGDIVFIQQVDDVDDGQMAAVCIDDTATLKYVYKEKDGVTLNPANPRYRPMHFDASNCDNIYIVGRAVAKFSWLD